MDELTLFVELLHIIDDEDRQARLAEIASSEPVLAKRLAELLEAHNRASQFLEEPAQFDDFEKRTTVPLVESEKPGQSIGPYKLLQKIGEGGMGIVYMAEQSVPVQRRVALKVIKAGMDSKRVIARFEAERQALALMDHPNIAKVLDAGTTDNGRPYFVMELVKGVPITTYCDERKLSIRERLELMVPVCQAIQHAHQKGIIHRDIKPSNVLVAQYDEKPVPKVIDFGVAKATSMKLTDKTMFTEFGQVIGTIEYMSPEQAQFNQLDIDTRSDIYSLGVMLYELTTGSTPLDGNTLRSAGIAEMMRMIREVDPPKPSHKLSTVATLPSIAATRNVEPSKLRGTVKGELDWIIMKALEKERVRRYATCADLSDDLQRFLNGDAVEAVPPSLQYKVMKSMRRNKGVTIAASLIAASIVASAIFSSIRYINERAARQDAEQNREIASARAIEAQQAADEATRQRQEAELQRTEAELQREETRAQRDLAQRNLYFADMRLAAVDVEAGNLERAERNLIRHVPLNAESDFRGWEWYYLLGMCHQEEKILYGHTSFISDIAWSPDGRYIATTSHDASMRVWDTTTWKCERVFNEGTTIHLCVAWSPDSRFVAWGSASDESCVRIWDRVTDKVSYLFPEHDSVWAIDWKRNNKEIVVGSIILGAKMQNSSKDAVGNVTFWDVASGMLKSSYMVSNQNLVTSLGFDGKDEKLAITNRYREGSVVWTQKSAVPLGDDLGINPSFADWHPNNGTLAVGTDSGLCLIFDKDLRTVLRKWQAHLDEITTLKWDQAGMRLLTSSSDGQIKVWDAASLTVDRRVQSNGIVKATWHPDSNSFATSSNDFAIKVWSSIKQPIPTKVTIDGQRSIVKWNSESDQISVVDASKRTIDRFDFRDGRRIDTIGTSNYLIDEFCCNHSELNLSSYAFEPQDFNQVASTNPLGFESVEFDPLRSCVLSPSQTKFAFLVKQGAQCLVAIKDRKTNTVSVGPRIYGITAMSWAPDETRLAVSGGGIVGLHGGLRAWSGWIHILDSRTAEIDSSFDSKSGMEPATTVAWSSDNSRIAFGDASGFCEVWDVTSRKRLLSERVHLTSVTKLSWGPDNHRIITGCKDGSAQLWDSHSGTSVMSLASNSSAVLQIQWSPDGEKIALQHQDGDLTVWKAINGYNFVRGDAWHRVIEPLQLQEFNQLVQQREWSKADKALDKQSQAGADKPFPLIRKAMIALQDNDQDVYRKICVDLIHRFGTSELRQDLRDIAFLCAISPDTSFDFNSSIVMAKKYADMYVNRRTGWCYQSDPFLILGANLYRAGRRKEALDALVFAKTRYQGPNRWILDLYLAMCLSVSGQGKAAKMYFANACKATNLIESEMKSRLSWSDEITLKTLRDEAAKLLNTEPGESNKYAKEEELVNGFAPYATVAANVGEELFISAMSAYAPSISPVLNSMAWDVATSLDASEEELELAITRATKAVELEPNESSYHNTLGVAHYRAGHWSDSVNSLNRSIELRANSEKSIALDSLYLAMAHWQLGEKEKAMECHKRGIVDLETNKVPDAEAVRPEVEKLLGIEQSPTQESEPKQETRPDDNAKLNTVEQEKSPTVAPVAEAEGSK